MQEMLLQLISSGNPIASHTHPYVGHHPVRDNYAHDDEHRLHNIHTYDHEEGPHYGEGEPYHLTHASHPMPRIEHTSEDR